LAIDEIQVRGGKPFEDNLLTNLIDDRYSAMRPTLLMANLPHEELTETLGASIVDRVTENGAVIHCDWPSFRANPPQ
jgi:DNA replication protein DnaC